MTPRLRPVPDAPLRALGLIRVSKERDNMVSPELQKTAINGYCQTRGYVVTEWVEGIDESGSRSRSAWWAKLDAAAGRVETGSVDVIVVWKFSRTARHRLRWAVALDRVEAAGGALESATEQIDASTSTGRFTRGMLAELAAFEAERIGDTWKEAHARRIRMGIPATGKPRFGYQIVKGGVHTPDPETGPVLAACYRRYVAGESIYSLVTWLNRSDIRTVGGYRPPGSLGLWTHETLRRILDSGFAAGWFTSNGQLIHGTHEPLIDETLWAAYQAARATRKGRPGRPATRYLLSGMMRCTCGSAMAGGHSGGHKVPRFRCQAASQSRSHPANTIRTTVAEGAVRAWLVDLVDQGQVDGNTDAVAAAEAKVARRAQDAELLGKEIAALDRQLATLTVQLAREIVPESAYMTARAEIEQQRTGLVARHAVALAEATPFDPTPIAADLLADWDTGALTMEERRGMLRSLISHIAVPWGPGTGPIRIVPTWEG